MITSCVRMLTDVAIAVATFAAGFAIRPVVPRLLNRLRYRTAAQTKLVIIVRTDLQLSSGKVGSQCAHAAVACYKEMLKVNPKLVAMWEAQGQPKIVLRAQQPGEYGLTSIADLASQHQLTAIIVRDAGRTQVASNTATVVAIGPGEAKTIDQVTRNYRLL